MDQQEYINSQFDERLDKLENKVDDLKREVTELKVDSAKQTIILEKIENNVNQNNNKMLAVQNKVFWGIVGGIGALILAFLQQLFLG